MSCKLTSVGVQHILNAHIDSLQVLLLDKKNIRLEGFLLALKLPLKCLSVGSNNIEIYTECDIVTDIEKVNIPNNDIKVFHPSFKNDNSAPISSALMYWYPQSSLRLASSYLRVVKSKNSHPIELNYYYEKAIDLLIKSCSYYSENRGKATYKLGKIYESQREYTMAKQYYQDSANKCSYSKSYLALGKLLCYMKDWKEALTYFQKYGGCKDRVKPIAFELGTSLYHLGRYEECEQILSGDNVTDDPQKKIQCVSMLGVIYYKGLNNKMKDYNKAFNLLISNHSDATSQYLCAKMYEKGRGTEASLPKAFDILTNLSKQGHGKSMVRIGKWYRRGIHVEQDHNKALLYFLESENLNPKSKSDIGKEYLSIGDIGNAFSYLALIPTNPENPAFDLEGLSALCLLYLIRNDKAMAYPLLNCLLFKTTTVTEEVITMIQSIADFLSVDKSIVEILDHCQLILTTVDPSLFAFAMCKSFAEKQDKESFNIWINLIEDSKIAHIVCNVFEKDVNALMLSLLCMNHAKGNLLKLFQNHSYGESFSMLLKHIPIINEKNYSQRLSSVGLMFIENGMKDEAVFFFDRVEYEEIFLAALELEKRNHFEIAIKYYEKRLSDPNALVNLGAIYYRQPHLNLMKAVECFERALYQNPTDNTKILCYYNAGLVWTELGNNSRAISNFSKAWTQHGDIDSAIEMTILDEKTERLMDVRKYNCSDDQKLRIAQCFAKDKSLTRQAWKWYNDIQIISNQVAKEVADYLVRVDLYNEGIMWSSRVLQKCELKTEQHWYQFYNALCHCCSGNDEEALNKVQLSSIELSLATYFPISHCLKAKLFKRKGMGEEAMQVVKNVLEDTPDCKLANYLKLAWSNESRSEIDVTDYIMDQYETVIAKLSDERDCTTNKQQSTSSEIGSLFFGTYC